jgi:hypothetical protein
VGCEIAGEGKKRKWEDRKVGGDIHRFFGWLWIGWLGVMVSSFVSLLGCMVCWVGSLYCCIEDTGLLILGGLRVLLGAIGICRFFSTVYVSIK